MTYHAEIYHLRPIELQHMVIHLMAYQIQLKERLNIDSMWSSKNGRFVFRSSAIFWVD